MTIHPLTERETDVIDHYVQGLSGRQIADSLGISPRTVEIYRANVLRKLGARTITHAAVIYDRVMRGAFTGNAADAA